MHSSSLLSLLQRRHAAHFDDPTRGIYDQEEMLDRPVDPYVR